MVKRKKKVVKIEPQPEEPTVSIGPTYPIATESADAPAPTSIRGQLKSIIAEFEADPLVPMDCEYPREYGEKIFPRYQKFLVQLKKLAE